MSVCTTASTAEARTSVRELGRAQVGVEERDALGQVGRRRARVDPDDALDRGVGEQRAGEAGSPEVGDAGDEDPARRIWTRPSRRVYPRRLPMPIHVHPTAELAPRALLPGDPGRALALAQVLLDEPRMFNHNRGLWGYTGPAKADGAPLTIQSTGMGGPSAAIVVQELIELGAARSRSASAPAARCARSWRSATSSSPRGAGAGRRRAARSAPAAARPATRALTAALGGAAGAPAQAVVSHDLFYDPVDRIAEWTAQGAVAVEMEAATLFARLRRRGVRARLPAARVSDALLGERAAAGPRRPGGRRRAARGGARWRRWRR